MTRPIKRQSTSDELLTQLRRAVARLTRAMNAVDEGEVDAIDDVAAVLRTMICRGKGDDLVRRVIRAHQLEWPVFCVTGPPQDGRDVFLSFGNVPVRYDADATIETTFKRLDQWSVRAALVLRGAARRTMNWEHLIAEYANTYGSHASTTVPEVLDSISKMHADQMNLGEYLIWCAGIAVEQTLVQMLDAVDGRSILRTSKARTTPLLGLTLTGENGGYVSPLQHGEAITKWREVLKLHPSEHVWLRIVEEPDSTGETDGLFTYEQAETKPDWWT